MIVTVGDAGETALVEQDDFGSLKVVAPATMSLEDVAARLSARVDADDHVWIPAGVLAGLAARDAEWRASFDRMLEKVEPYGWYDAAAQAVKAHVEHR